MEKDREVESTPLRSPDSKSRKAMEPNDAAFFLRKRYYVISSIAFSWIVMVLLRTNLSICLVDMTSKKTYVVGNTTYTREPEFKWTSMEKGIILSAFSWGQFLSPVGGLLVNKYGGVNVFGVGMLTTGALTIVSPILIKWHLYAYLVGRFLEGLFEGIAYSGQGTIYVHWTPAGERTILINIALSGLALGYGVTYPIVGYLTYIFNWEATFYFTGGISVVWSLLWLSLVKEHPTKDKVMSEAERNYLGSLNTTRSTKKIAPPWKEMLLSLPLWALLNERFVESWSSSFLKNCIPLYIKDIYDVNINTIGWFSSIPNYFLFFGKIPAALLADYLRRNDIFRKTQIHRFYILFAQIGAFIFLFTAAIVKNFFISIVLFCLFKLSYSLAFVSYCILPIDLGAHHSGFIFGLCIMVNSIGSTLNPLLIGFMVTDHTFGEWSRYFFFLGALNLWAAGFFAFYGSGELQPWAVSDDRKTKKKLGVTSEG